MDIELLVEKAKNGDQNAFEQLYNSTKDKAYYTALKITKNPEDAEDMIQDAYIKAYNKMDTLKENKKFSSWFNCIVANNCRNYMVKKKPMLFSELSDEDSDYDFEDTLEDIKSLSPEEFADNEELKEMIIQCIDKLPDEHKMCLIMFYYDEMSIKEIAESLQISEGTVKSRLFNAKKKLKEEFDELEKKGIKLYGIPAIPLIRLAFMSDSKNVHISSSILETIKKTILASTAKSTTSGVAATVGTSTTASTVAATASVSATKKIVLGIVAIAVVISGVAVGTIAYKKTNDNNIKEITTSHLEPPTNHITEYTTTTQLSIDEKIKGTWRSTANPASEGDAWEDYTFDGNGNVKVTVHCVYTLGDERDTPVTVPYDKNGNTVTFEAYGHSYKFKYSEDSKLLTAKDTDNESSFSFEHVLINTSTVGDYDIYLPMDASEDDARFDSWNSFLNNTKWNSPFLKNNGFSSDEVSFKYEYQSDEYGDEKGIACNIGGVTDASITLYSDGVCVISIYGSDGPLYMILEKKDSNILNVYFVRDVKEVVKETWTKVNN